MTPLLAHLIQMLLYQALYPAIIIALVALNRSPIDNAISRHIRHAPDAADGTPSVSAATVDSRVTASESI